MRTQAAKERKLFFLAAALVLVVTAQGTIPAEASRTNSPPITATLEPSFASTETLVRITEETDDQAENRFRLFEDLSLPPHPLEWVLVRKTASGVFDLGIECNIWQTGGLSQDCSSPSFQGLWTDPTTGLSYARNRWYDARTASWLSEDPMGAVDSPNLYAFVGWQPHMATDPMGLAGYFFDGTTNEGDNLTKSPTNVQVLSWMYAPEKRKYYVRGVGTVSEITAGKFFGKRGREKLDQMFAWFEERYVDEGDKEIDIFGFSRGAALAREFANMIAEKYPDAEIRFLGLFDTVAQFGLADPFNINRGIRLDIPETVEFTAHAVSKNEYRVLFPLTSIVDHYGGYRLSIRGIDPEVYRPCEIVDFVGPHFWEKAFEGSHGDIGGGQGRNLDVLKWMVNVARSKDVPISWNAKDYQHQKSRVTHDEVIEDSRFILMDRIPCTKIGRGERIVFPGNLEQ